MRFSIRRYPLMLIATLLFITGTTASVRTYQRSLPNPVLYLSNTEFLTIRGKQVIRYHYAVENAESYPAELFTASPDLPPCGNNTKSSRTWVDIYAQDGKRLNGFCALGKPADLNGIWFALDSDVIPPSWIYIELTDRKTTTKYKSNLAETTE